MGAIIDEIEEESGSRDGSVRLLNTAEGTRIELLTTLRRTPRWRIEEPLSSCQAFSALSYRIEQAVTDKFASMTRGAWASADTSE